MPSPRQVMREAVRDCLQRIQIADGYATDAGDTVVLEPAPVASEDKTAFITVVWSRQQRPDTDAVLRTHRLTTIDVVAKVPASVEDAQTKLDDIVSDIERAMEKDQNFRFPNGYQFPQYQSAEPLAGAINDGWVGVVLTYTSNIPKQPTT